MCASTRDVVLYLVNAAETPEAAAYVEAEMAAAGMARQAGAGAAQPDGTAARDRVGGAGRDALAAPPAGPARRLAGAADGCVRALLGAGVDAAARGAGRARRARREPMARLCDAWQRMREDTFEPPWRCWRATWRRSPAPASASSRHAGLGERVKRLVGRLGPLFGSADRDDPTAQAQAALAARLDDDVRASTVELLALHGLEGRAEATSWRAWRRSSTCACVCPKAGGGGRAACSAAHWPA